MSLADLPLGVHAVIARVDLDDVDGALLRAMGLAPGQKVRVLRKAPFGGPLQVRVGEGAFAIARSLARSVEVVASPAN